MRLGVIADDLTGALDTGVQFTRHGLGTYVALEWKILFTALKALHLEGYVAPDPDVAVVNSRTRSLSDKYSVIRQTLLTLWALESAERLFVKIDSTLRGPWRHTLECIPPSRARQIVVCPAFPGQGRMVHAGAVYLAGGRRVGDIRTANDRISDAWEVPDAETDADLDAVIDEHWNEPGVLWCGSAGLAAALARRFAREVPPNRLQSPLHWDRCRRVAVVIGSRTELSRMQIECLEKNGGMGDATVLFVDPHDDGGDEDPMVAERLAAALADGHAQCPYDGLILSGGETADRVLARLRVQTIDVAAELLPGCPLGVLRGWTADGMRVVTKSGSFGGEDTLVRLVRMLQGGPA